jgi:hypothetical protein
MFRYHGIIAIRISDFYIFVPFPVSHNPTVPNGGRRISFKKWWQKNGSFATLDLKGKS